MLLRILVLFWLVRVSASDEDIDWRKYTCIMPVVENEALATSQIWRRWMDHAAASWTSAGSAVTDQLPEELQRATQDSAPHSIVKKALDAHSMHVPGRVVLSMVDKAAVEECSQQGGLKADLHAGVRKAMHRSVEGLSRAPLWRQLVPSDAGGAGREPALPSVGLLNEGVDCFAICGKASGSCASGFCGAGVCCKQWEFHPDCPLGFHSACRDRHCCVARQINSSIASQREPCSAEPGYFCLSSLIVGYQQYFSSVQLCTFQRTVKLCLRGFYCPGGITSPKACPKGRWCPPGRKDALPCPRFHYCPTSTIKHRCNPGFWCDYNTVVPRLCEAGRYCDQLSLGYPPCPPGAFCPEGTGRPEPCPLLITCGPGQQYPDWSYSARNILLIVLLGWTAVIRTIPGWLRASTDPSKRRLQPILVVPLSLLMAWACYFDCLHATLAAIAPNLEGLDRFRFAAIVGGDMHSTSLLFFSATNIGLLYATLISRISRQPTRKVLDCLFGVLAFLGFAWWMQDRSCIAFAATLWITFAISWVVLSRQGVWRFRVGLLSVALAALGGSFLLLDAPELAYALAVALAAMVAKEVFSSVSPWLQLFMRRRRVAIAESILSDAPFRPLINSLASEAAGAERSVRDIVSAACVTAGARASLATHREGATGTATARSRNPEAWAPWTAHLQRSARGAASSNADGLSFDLQNVCFHVGNGRKLLQDLTFSIPAGSSVAVMGASGSGKTTLLSVLSGRCGDDCTSGELRLSHSAMTPEEMSELRSIIGFVPQDDVMYSMLTVAENIDFQAQLRLPPQHGAAANLERREQVDSVINSLGLSHVRDRIISDGLSGGQRKRVSIGMETVCQPRVLMLDEPTTGLDSSIAHRMLEGVLSDSRRNHRTTISTIHTPRWALLDVFEMLVLLAPGGHLCYAGPVCQVKAYCEEVLQVEFPPDENPADIIIDTCTFASARNMALDGSWRSPPMCLRAVLYPTPEATQEESNKSAWQEDEFGRMLATLWQEFAATQNELLRSQPGPTSTSCAGAEPAQYVPLLQYVPASAAHGGRDKGGSEQPMLKVATRSDRSSGEVASFPDTGSPKAVFLELQDTSATDLAGDHPNGTEPGIREEARQRVQLVNWGQQVWVHVSRALLVLSRSRWSTLIIEPLCLMALLQVGAMVSKIDAMRCLQNASVTFFMLSISQAVVAQRVFAGEECQAIWRESSTTSLPQVLYSFIGKDAASAVQIWLWTMLWSHSYLGQNPTFATGPDLFDLGAGLLYFLWGINFIMAVAFPGPSGILAGVVYSVLAWLLCGARPATHEVVQNVGKYMLLPVYMSPVKWASSLLIYRHLGGPGSPFLGDGMRIVVDETLSARGFSPYKVYCPSSTSIAERWVDQSGWICTSTHMFLLGMLCRVVAALLLLSSSSARAGGGQLPVGAPSVSKSRLMRDSLMIFVGFSVLLSLVLVGRMTI